MISADSGGSVMRCLIDQRFRVIVMERMKLKKH